MLVLTRRIGEEIMIDKGQIKIKILNIRNGLVAVGIQAPNRVDVDRKEIFFRKKNNPQRKPVEKYHKFDLSEICL